MSEGDCANPLLLGWVKEWYETARDRNSKGVTTYRHAYESLKACPIAFEHPSQLQQLKGFGPKLCERLTELLKKHCDHNGLPMPEHPGLRKRLVGTGGGPEAEDGDTRDGVRRRARGKKAYVPAYRSGAYAILLALSMLDEDAAAGMTKAELTEAAQQHCDASFTAPSDPTKFYTAWNSMKTLVQRELVYERGRPLKRYALTDEGWEVAGRIRRANSRDEATQDVGEHQGSVHPARRAAPSASGSLTNILLDDDDDDGDDDEGGGGGGGGSGPRARQQAYDNVLARGKAPEDTRTLPEVTPIRLQPGSFTVQLVLDVREVRAKTDRDYMQEELAKKGARPIMRSLGLGDALWIAKCNEPGLLGRQGAEGDEVVLDYIVERKRLDDLIGSIKDGRFHEQKFRLRKSGMRHVVYLVEEVALDPSNAQKYEEAVQSAIASTQVVNGFFLKRTQKMDESIRYLARMTALLKKMYESKTLHVIPTELITAQNYAPLQKHLRETKPGISHHISYPAFASLASKSDTMTLRDVYLKMLMCTRGVTGEKATEIQKRWKTPYDLVEAFERCGAGEEAKKRKREMVFREMQNLVGRKRMAKAVSQRVAEVWGDA